ncbi:hypothetical protein [Lacticaseibacillus phage Lphi2ADMT26]|nr:hypothetical protein [Lacticaseibacillus phage Lphi2ADMT26]
MTLRIVDLSSHNNTDLAAYPADGYIVKVTEGTGYVNPLAAGHVTQAKQRGALLGLYMFLLAGVSGAEQAKYFLNQSIVAQNIGTAPLFIDFEDTNYSNITNAAGVSTALDAIRYIKKETGTTPLIYMSRSVENSLDWSSVVAENVGLWVAEYGKPLQALKHWSDVALWQFSSTPYDQSYFYGTAATWAAYAKATKKPDPTPAPAPTPQPGAKQYTDAQGIVWYPETGKVTLNTAVNLRWGAYPTSTLIATLPAGSAVTYDYKAHIGNRIVVRQPRSGGYGYLTVGTANAQGVNVDPYGTFS